jgi:hypothetical protein
MHLTSWCRYAAGEERVTAPDAEPGRAEEPQAMERFHVPNIYTLNGHTP